ncbi:MAG: YkgJ family cysteine cluster protein [Methanomicrobiaceae archaeon]|nr:YkgJ family cysteine cluster protein [Methanomicrobiaceae archaeon]
MGEFVCTRCGKCCMSMKPYVKILGRLGPFRFLCRHELGQETREVVIERDCRDRFSDEENGEGNWCPFLLEDEGDEGYSCAIYGTRPRFCREFACARMRVYGKDGSLVGTLKGKKSLVTADPALQALWEGSLGTDLDEAASRLRGAGYRVEMYD